MPPLPLYLLFSSPPSPGFAFQPEGLRAEVSGSIPREHGVRGKSLGHHSLSGLDEIRAVYLLEHPPGTSHVLKKKAGSG